MSFLANGSSLDWFGFPWTQPQSSVLRAAPDSDGDATGGGRTGPTGNTGDAGGAGRAGDDSTRAEEVDPGDYATGYGESAKRRRVQEKLKD